MTADIDNPTRKDCLGAIDMVPSQHMRYYKSALREIREQNIPIYSVELTEDAEDFPKG